MQGDLQVISELKSLGCDLSKPMLVNHYLYFFMEDDAKNVALNLQKSGYEAEASRAALGDAWLVLASRQVTVSESSVLSFRAYFEELVKPYEQGEYDGWEAQLNR